MRNNICRFCLGSRMHTCTSFQCELAHEKAEEYIESIIARTEVAKKKRKYVKPLESGELKAEGFPITEAWIVLSAHKEEFIIRFQDNIPKMQQSAYLEMIKERRTDAEQIRAWKAEDGETIRNGIPFNKEEEGNEKI